MPNGNDHYVNLLRSRWVGIISRCTNSNAANYKNYGGRGINVCNKWKVFEVFYEDMLPGFSPKLQLDRINNNKGYCKSNCRWVTQKKNANNRRNSLPKRLQTQLESNFISRTTYTARLLNGWPELEARTQPPLSKYEVTQVRALKIKAWTLRKLNSRTKGVTNEHRTHDRQALEAQGEAKGR